jgi:hypothetical protein
MPGFGRRFAADPRDRNYLMRRMLPDARTLALPTRKTWGINKTALDQGNTGTCVGHAWRNFLRCAPIRTVRRDPSPFDIYRSAVLKDPWADNDDEANLPDGDSGLDVGTSVRAGAEAVTGFGLLKSYVWAFELQPAVDGCSPRGRSCSAPIGTRAFSVPTRRASSGSQRTPQSQAAMRTSGAVSTRGERLRCAPTLGATIGADPANSFCPSGTSNG